jgi:hypothetical protein
MFQFTENFKLINIHAAGSMAAADAAVNMPGDTGVDLWSGGMPDKLVLLIQVTSVGSGGKLDLIVEDSSDRSTWDADFATLPQITATGVYIAVIKNPKQYVRVNANSTTDAVAFCVLGLSYDEKRRPVTQPTGAVLTVTYGTDRASEPQT